MEQAQFEVMITNLDKIVTECLDIKNKCPDDEAFKDLTIREAELISKRCRKLQGMQDRIFDNELYHILGMGDLSPVQEIVFLRLIKDLGATRSYIKAIINYEPPTIPAIPCKAEYKCTTLGVDLSKSI